MSLKFVSLFAGIGGFDLALERSGMECIGQVENNAACRAVLRQHFPNVKQMEDVKGVRGEDFPGCDVLVGGFPCQDISVANAKREGLAGGRSGLWFEFHRLIREIRPRYVIVENVPGLLSSHQGRDFAVVLGGLTGFLPDVPDAGWKSGGAARGLRGFHHVAWRVLDAQYFGVPHRRRRVFIVASAGNGSCAEILLESDSSAWDNAQTQSKEVSVECYPPDSSAWWDGRVTSQTLDHVLYKKQAMPEKQRFPAVIVPTWIPCPDCDDYWCNLHGMHAYDCPCPEIDVWAEEELYPYAPSVLRYITPLEAERLQGFPDGYTAGQSDSQRYRQLGNAVAVPVVEWIGKRLVEVENRERGL